MIGPINMTVAGLTFRQLFTRKRLIASALFAASPLLIALFFRATGHTNDPTGVQFLRELYSGIVAFVLLPLSAVVFGTAAFGGEIDDGTIVYLLVKSLPRWQLVLSKYVVAVISTFVMTFVAILLPWLALGVQSDSAPLLEGFTAGIALGAALYCAIFVTMGLMSKRALVMGLLYIVVLEITLSPNVVGLKSLSVREFVMTVVGKVAAGVPGVKVGAVSTNTVWTMGAIILVASLALGIRWLQQYEMAERI
jgi:ABC-2 type transport system permease protein